MSASMLPLATLLAIKTKTDLIASDNTTKNFLPRDPKPGERILLIDTNVGSGVTLKENVQKITDLEAVYEDAFFLVLNDCHLRPFNIERYRNEYHKLVPYLYEMSDLVELREKLRTSSILGLPQPT